MGKLVPINYVRSILAFLRFLDDDEEAQEFVRLSIKAQEKKAFINNQPYNRHEVLSLICSVEKHRWQDRPDMIDDVKDERYKICRICGEVTRNW